MAHASSKEKRATREEALGTILTIPGVVKEPVWRELADEAEVYLKLYKRLSKEPLDSPEREALEDKMILSLAHLYTHSRVLYEVVDEAIEKQAAESSWNDISLVNWQEETSEKGLLDYLEEGNSAQQGIITFLNELSDHTRSMSTKLTEHTSEIQDSSRFAGPQTVKINKISVAVHRSVTLLNKYSGQIETGLPVFRKDVSRFIESYSKLILWNSVSEDEQAQTQEYRTVLEKFKQTLSQSIKSTHDFLRAIQGIPSRVSHKLTGARDSLINRITAILDSLKELEAFAEDTSKKLDR